jgi:hypothetical protein
MLGLGRGFKGAGAFIVVLKWMRRCAVCCVREMFPCFQLRRYANKNVAPIIVIVEIVGVRSN